MSTTYPTFFKVNDNKRELTFRTIYNLKVSGEDVNCNYRCPDGKTDDCGECIFLLGDKCLCSDWIDNNKYHLVDDSEHKKILSIVDEEIIALKLEDLGL